MYNYAHLPTTKFVYALELTKNVDSEKETEEMIYQPPIHTLLELFSLGELFHPRSKVFITKEDRERRDLFISGILNCSYARVPSLLISSKPYQIESLFNYYKLHYVKGIK